ncbi:MAG: hypothetical protein Q8Q33_06615 [Chlamydiota bacterium]|nr:hypothetical protein [Chlamydiota bacterium]
MKHAKFSLLVCFSVLIISMLNISCNSGEDENSIIYSGIYQVDVIEGGVTQSHRWQMTQVGAHIVIEELDSGINVEGQVSGNILIVPQQNVIYQGESYEVAMSISFENNGMDFAGTKTTTMDGFSYKESLRGTSLLR